MSCRLSLHVSRYQSVESGTHSVCPPLRAPGGGGGGYRGSTESADWSRPDGKLKVQYSLACVVVIR
jgi:hypothetical protein